ncbi:hypothetical protein PSTT_04238 [Puccinia striiformis]|uniref:Uncharacterized protein n=1 Tax=Puccinia striiformis TaxID=27350 RepID=A0A2S4VT22_9BASI|nr:hypothetical protein PSTT_04238 [Puccinia striiformis]
MIGGMCSLRSYLTHLNCFGHLCSPLLITGPLIVTAMIKVEGADCSIMSHLTGLDVERCCITQVTNGPDHQPAPVGTIITIPRKSVVYGTLNHPLKHPNQDCVPATGA